MHYIKNNMKIKHLFYSLKKIIIRMKCITINTIMNFFFKYNHIKEIYGAHDMQNVWALLRICIWETEHGFLKVNIF